MNLLLVRILVLCSVCLTSIGRADGGSYHLVQTFKLKGDTGWDYLTMDSASNRLFLSRGIRVAVIDVRSGEEIGEIAGTDGVHGVALALDLGKGFTSNGRAGTVTVFDAKTLKTTATIAVGKNPDAIVYEPSTKRIFVFNGKSKTATVIDAVTNKVLATLELGGKPEFAAVDPTGKVFVNLEDKNAIVVIDAKKLSKLAEWPIASCDEPTGLSLDSKKHRLFAGCHNERLFVVNAENGKVVTSLPIGKGVDATAFDPQTQLVFSSNGEGTLTVIHENSPDAYAVIETVPTQKSARTMALDEGTHRVFAIAAKFEEHAPANPPQRPQVIPNSTVLLVLDR